RTVGRIAFRINSPFATCWRSELAHCDASAIERLPKRFTNLEHVAFTTDRLTAELMRRFARRRAAGRRPEVRGADDCLLRAVTKVRVGDASRSSELQPALGARQGPHQLNAERLRSGRSAAQARPNHSASDRSRVPLP